MRVICCCQRKRFHCGGNRVGLSLACSVLLLCWGGAIGFSQAMGGLNHPPPASSRSNIPTVQTDISLDDIAAQAGLTFTHVSGDPLRKKFLLEATGSGVAIFDYD